MGSTMKPIIFCTESIQAILDGYKSQTRRVAMPGIQQPKYKPGDILYVRETWQEVFETEYDPNADGYCVSIRTVISNFDDIPKMGVGLSREYSCELMRPREKYYVYKASEIHFTDQSNRLIWRSPIYMPREAARIFLRVTDVREEWVQDISEEDIKAEGLHYKSSMWKSKWTTPAAYRMEFQRLWNSLNARRGYGWETNPRVWVNTFERVSREEAQ